MQNAIIILLALGFLLLLLSLVYCLYTIKQLVKKKNTNPHTSVHQDPTQIAPQNEAESPYAMGRTNTSVEQVQINRMIEDWYKENPNHLFFQLNPEYEEKILKRVDISEIENLLKPNDNNTNSHSA